MDFGMISFAFFIQRQQSLIEHRLDGQCWIIWKLLFLIFYSLLQWVTFSYFY